MSADTRIGNKELLLQKPTWSGKLPDEELKKIRVRTSKRSFEPGFYGIQFTGKQVDEVAVSEIALILADTSEEFFRAGERIAFFRFGDKKRQIILPLRKSNVGPHEALNMLNDVVRQATSKLEQAGLPVVGLPPFNLNPFKAKQLGETR